MVGRPGPAQCLHQCLFTKQAHHLGIHENPVLNINTAVRPPLGGNDDGAGAVLRANDVEKLQQGNALFVHRGRGDFKRRHDRDRQIFDIEGFLVELQKIRGHLGLQAGGPVSGHDDAGHMGHERVEIGDDDKTLSMLTSPEIAASGAISVTSNIAPQAVSDMIRYGLEGNHVEAQKIAQALQPLFSIITVKTQEQSAYGPVACKARNPLATKTLMNVLGMPSGSCRQPLGKMTRSGLEVVLSAARKVYENNPEILAPIESFFDVELKDRLYNERYLEGLSYA